MVCFGMPAACPSNPPPPAGYAVWQGAVPAELSNWAVDIRDHEIGKVPYWSTWSKDYNGVTVLARKDYHTWTYINGQLITGICIPGITLYQPIAQDAAFFFREQPTDHPFDSQAFFTATAGVVVVLALFWAAIHFAGKR